VIRCSIAIGTIPASVADARPIVKAERAFPVKSKSRLKTIDSSQTVNSPWHLVGYGGRALRRKRRDAPSPSQVSIGAARQSASTASQNGTFFTSRTTGSRKSAGS